MGNEIVMLSAREVNFTDEKNGRNVVGVSIRYCENLTPKSYTTGNGTLVFGIDIFDDFLPIECMKNIVSVPGVYDVTYELRMGRDKRPVNKIVGVTYLNEL